MAGVVVDRRVSNSPEWPSLYDPGLEILHIPHRPPTQLGATYLYDAHDVFRFTLYWSLILYTPMFVFCGLYAFLNLSSPPRYRPDDVFFPLSSLSPRPSTGALLSNARERRSRLILTLLVLLFFLAVGVTSAVVGATVIAFVLFGFFKAAQFNMSTWVPVIWVLIFSLVNLISIWSSIIDII